MIFYSGNFDVVKLLIENGAEINAKTKFDETALFLAADAGKNLFEIQRVNEFVYNSFYFLDRYDREWEEHLIKIGTKTNATYDRVSANESKKK